MVLYVVSMIVSVFFAHLAYKTKKNSDSNGKALVYCIFCFLSFLLPFLLSAFRAYTVGSDTGGTYMKIYEYVLSGDIGAVRDSGYAFVNKVALLFSDNYTSVLFLSSLLICGLCYKRIFSESKYPALSVLLFFATNVYFISMNMVRQSIGISIFIFALPYIQKRKLIKSAILILLATTMHSSCVLYFFVYFIINIKIKPKYILGFTGIIFILGNLISSTIISILLKLQFFRTYFAWYLNSNYQSGEINKVSLIISIGILIFLICINKKAKNDKKYTTSLNLTIISTSILLLSAFIPLAQRTSWLFSFPLFIYLPNMFDYIDSDKRIIKYIIILGYLAYMTYTIFILGYHGVVPYSSVFTS